MAKPFASARPGFDRSRELDSSSSRSGVRDPSAVVARVRREHATLGRLLDDVESALLVIETEGGLARVRGAAWELRLTLEAHLDMEEAQLAPLWREREGGEARAVNMILEHNEQRRCLRELVEDLESDVLEVPAVVARTGALVRQLRSDVAAEERELSETRRCAVGARIDCRRRAPCTAGHHADPRSHDS